MNNLAVFVFQGHDVRFVGTADKPEWVAKDVCFALGIDPTQTRRLDADQKGISSVYTSGGAQKMTTVNESGVRRLICTSRKPLAKDLAKSLGIEVHVVGKESQNIGIIAAAFPELDPKFQFPIGSYRIDLYLDKANIAVECDEDGHSGYCKSKESDRERHIKSELKGCRIVRFNPDAKGFNVGSVIAQIRAMV